MGSLGGRNDGWFAGLKGAEANKRVAFRGEGDRGGRSAARKRIYCGLQKATGISALRFSSGAGRFARTGEDPRLRIPEERARGHVAAVYSRCAHLFII